MYCGPFHILAYLLEHWEKGYLGVTLSVVALVIGLAIAIKYQHLMAIPVAIAFAVCLYFFPYVVSVIMGVNIQQCASPYRSYVIASNIQACLRTAYADQTPGTYCSCSGSTTQPTCASDASYCQSELINYVTSQNYCSCATANQTGSIAPVCTNYAPGSVAAVTNVGHNCSAGNSWSGSSFCAYLASLSNGSHPTPIYPVTGGSGWGG